MVVVVIHINMIARAVRNLMQIRAILFVLNNFRCSRSSAFHRLLVREAA